MSRAVTIENRAKLFRKLLDELGQRQIGINEIADILGYARSGGRAVIKRMVEAGLVEREVTPTGNAHNLAMYELIGTPEQVDAFIASVEQAHMQGCAGREARKEAAERRNLRRELDSNRHIHLISHDAPHYAKTVKKIPQADPILAHLFGRAA